MNAKRKKEIWKEYDQLYEELRRIDAPEKIVAIVDRMEPLVKELGDKREIAYVISARGGYYYYQCDYENAIHYTLEAIAILDEIGEKNGSLVRSCNLANMYHGKGDVLSAYRLRLENLSKAREIGNPRIIIDSLVGASHDLSYFGDWDKTLSFLLEALELSKKDGHFSRAIYSGLAETAFMQKNYSLSIEFAKSGLLNDDRHNLNGARAELLCKLGRAQELEGKVHEALGSILEALSISTEFNLPDNQSLAAAHLGDIYFSMGQIQQAIESFQTSIDLMKHGRIHYTLQGKIGLAKCFALNKDFNSAISIISKAKSEAENLNWKDGMSNVLEEQYRIQKSIGDITGALATLEQKIQLDMEWQSEKTKLRLQSLQVEKEVEAMKRKIIDIQEGKEQLERELTTKALAYASQTELLATFREDLRRIIRKIEVRDPAINELIAKLKELPDGVNWKEFEEQFRQVHPEFKANLQKKFPELTEDELQVCALFRLKLKSPDIGKLLSLSYRTVQNRRNRIRKKLGLKGEDDIAKFLAVF